MTLPPALLAADPGMWLTLVFIILGLIAWIMNLASSKNPPPPVRGGRVGGGAAGAPPVRPQPRNRDERIQNEIDIFLEEVGAKKPAAEAAPRVERTELPPPRPVVRRERPMPAEIPTATVLPVEPPRPELERRRLAPSQIGSAAREHVGHALEAARLEPHIKQQVEAAVERTVQHQLGRLGRDEAAAAIAMAPPAAAGPHPLVRLLRDPAGIRNAVLVSEILAPPPALRRD